MRLISTSPTPQTPQNTNDRSKFGAQIVQEQRIYNLVDILDAGVVHAARASRRGVQRALEGRAKDGGLMWLQSKPCDASSSSSRRIWSVSCSTTMPPSPNRPPFT